MVCIADGAKAMGNNKGARDMPRLSVKKRMEVLRLHFLDFPYSEVVEKARISKGSVVNIIKELKEGVYFEFENVINQVEVLRKLAVGLRKSNFNVTKALLGLTFFKHLVDLGVES